MKHAKKTLALASILLATVIASVVANTRGHGSTGSPRTVLSSSFSTSSAGTPDYTTVTISDPALAGVDAAAGLALLDSLLHDTVQGTGTTADGTVALPNAEPPSLLVTRDAVEALALLDGSVPNASAVAAWVWSRWHAAGGYFDDEYSVNWSTTQDGTAWLASNRYSPVVATGCALDILSTLGEAIPADVSAPVLDFVMSCHDAAAGTFKGLPGAVEPTLQDAAWGIHVLARLGQLGGIDAARCGAHVASLASASSGLYQLHSPAIKLPAPEYNGATVPATRLAVEALWQLGRLGAVNVTAVRNAIMACYDPAQKHFFQDPYTHQRTAQATADGLRALSIVGLPADFTTWELPGIVASLAAEQLPGGGWPLEDGAPLAATAQSARVITSLVGVAGTTGAIDTARVKAALAASLSSNPAAGMAAYCPFPASRPNLPAACELALLAHQHGLADAAAEAAAVALVAAARSDGSGTYPRKYPGVLSLASFPAGEFRTMGTGGIEVLAPLVALKDAMLEPFSEADLNGLATVLSGIQYKGTAMPGLRGLCLTQHDLSPIYSLPGVQPRIASLEATHAAARLIGTLRGYSGGARFYPSAFLDLNLLCQRLSSGYRESAGAAWFEREAPVDYQSPAGLDNPKLWDTRLVVEILSMTGTLSHAAIASTVALAKLASLALNEPRRTVTDVDNAAAILAVLNVTASSAQRAAMAGAVLAHAMPGTGWYCRAGLPSAWETLRAWSVLSRFSGIVAELGHVVANGTAVEAYAGTRLSLSARLFNGLTGPGAPVALSYSIPELALASLGTMSPVAIDIPLRESALGPATLNVNATGIALSMSVTTPIVITGVLFLPTQGGRVVIAPPSRADFEAVLDLKLASPDNPSQQAAVHGAAVAARGTSIAHNASFAVDPAPNSGRYRAVLRVNPTEAETHYRLVATREHCAALDVPLAVAYADSVSYARYVVLPVGIAAAGPVLAIVARRGAKRVEVAAA